MQTRIRFLEKVTYNQIDEIIDPLYITGSIPNVSLNFISCQEIFKQYVLTSNLDLLM